MITHKRGATFRAVIDMTMPNGDPVDLTGATVRSAIRSASAHYWLDAVILGAADAGRVEVSASALSTSGWHLGTYGLDIAVNRNGFIDPFPSAYNLQLSVIEGASL